MSIRKCMGAAVAVLGALVLLGRDTRASEEKVKVDLGSAIKSIKLGGDIRLRQEYFDYEDQKVSRSRQRFRLRYGAEFSLKNDVKAIAKLASGGGDATSTNQSFDDLSQQKGIWIDQAYLEWKPLEALKISGGRMKNPLWVPYSNDVVWDGDFNPEGLGWNLKGDLFGAGRFFFNAMQIVADEDSGSAKDQWAFSEQIGVILPMPLDSRLTFAAANHYWLNTSKRQAEKSGNLGQKPVQDGNRREANYLIGTSTATNVLANNFSVLDLTAQYLTNVAPFPILLEGTYVKNLAALDKFDPKEDTGYQVGAVFGDSGPKKGFELAYYYKNVETDATVADVADSDFGEGGTNRKGHIVWVGYGLASHINLKAKYFATETLNEKLAPKVKDVNRLQLDLAVKF